MQKLQVLHSLLLSLAKEMEAEAAKYNAVSSQLFCKAINLLQNEPNGQYHFNRFKWQMLAKPGFKILIQDDCLVIGCNLIVQRASGRIQVVNKTLPSLNFCLTSAKDNNLAVVKNIFQEFTQLLQDKNRPDWINQYRSLEEFKLFMALLQIFLTY